MPRARSDKPYKKSYTEENVVKALKAIEEGLSERKAAIEFRVPRSTLQFRASDKFNDKTTHGPSPVFCHLKRKIL